MDFMPYQSLHKNTDMKKKSITTDYFPQNAIRKVFCLSISDFNLKLTFCAG